MTVEPHDVSGLTLSAAGHLDQVCDEFEQAWRQGTRPRIEDYLARATQPARSRLLEELLLSELECRRREGETPCPGDYAGRFPEDQELVQHVFGAMPGDTPARLDQPTVVTGGPELRPPGRRVGSYELLDELGRGGMGVVYKARQVGLNRLVALKMILAGEFAGPEQFARFRVEAEAAARLQHPGIVQIYDIGSHDGLPYFSLEYADGGSLRERLRAGPLPWRTAAALAAALAEAMHYAHQRGVVHRDLKPANILLARSDRTHAIRLATGPEEWQYYESKIGDFGLAKHLSAFSLAAGQGERAESLTQTGALLGTPSYMAPEQAGGLTHEIGPAADVYALGAVLYEMLTGIPPFRGQTPFDTLELIRSQEAVPPRRLQPKLPRDLETIALKCLQKEPHNRYTSAAALADDLERFLAGKPILARRAGPAQRAWRWCRRQPLAAGLVAALAMAVCGGFAGVVWQWRQAQHQADLVQRKHDQMLSQRQAARQQRDRALQEQARAESHLRSARELVDRLQFVAQQVTDNPGTEQVRYQALEEAVRFEERFLDQQPNDPAARKRTLQACLRAGRLGSELGHYEGAIRMLRRGVGLSEALAAEFSDNSAYRVSTALCHLELAHSLSSSFALF